MKVKVEITRAVEVEVDECIAELDNFWRTHTHDQWDTVPDALVNNAIKAIENATGLTFANETAKEKPCGTICFVNAMDGEAILEW